MILLFTVCQNPLKIVMKDVYCLGGRKRAKKVVSDSPGLVDFAIGLVNSVLNLPDGQVMFYEEFEKQKNKKFLGLVEMTSGLVNASFSLPEWQAVKMIFFAPWVGLNGMDG